MGGKGREIVKANATSVLAKEDVGGPKGQEIRFFVSEKQPERFILEVGGKSSNGSQMVTSFNDVGGGKTVSTTKNAVTDVGGRGTTLTGNLFVVFHSASDVGGTRDIKNIRKQVVTLYFDVGGKGIKNLRGVIPKTAFS